MHGRASRALRSFSVQAQGLFHGRASRALRAGKEVAREVGCAPGSGPGEKPGRGGMIISAGWELLSAMIKTNRGKFFRWVPGRGATEDVALEPVCPVAWKGRESYEGYGNTEKCVCVQKRTDRITFEPREETERHKAGTSGQPVARGEVRAGGRGGCGGVRGERYWTYPEQRCEITGRPGSAQDGEAA